MIVVQNQGRMNLVVLEYDRALKHTIMNLKKSEDYLAERNVYFGKKKKDFKDVSSSAIRERDEAISRRKPDRKKAAKLIAEVEAEQAKIKSLKEEKTAAEQERAVMAEETAREI